MAAVDGRLYLVGGVVAPGETSARMDVYEIARRRWARGPDMAVARDHLAAAALGRRVYALAGRRDGTNFGVAERYEPAARKWQRLPDMKRERGGNSAAPGWATASTPSRAARSRATRSRARSTSCASRRAERVCGRHGVHR